MLVELTTYTRTKEEEGGGIPCFLTFNDGVPSFVFSSRDAAYSYVAGKPNHTVEEGYLTCLTT